MKNMKKLFAVVLAVMLVMSLATTAFAADTYTITAPATTHQYEIYQIFTGSLSGGVLSDVKWGINGTGTTGDAVSDDILTELVGLSGKTDSEQLAVITNYVTLSNPVATITNGGTYTAAAGYYLIKDKAGTVSGVEDDSYTLYIVEVVGDVTIEPKGDVPSVDKVIVEGTTEVKENEASIGDAISYKFTGTLPSNIDDYAAYFYKFTDSMTKGLTITDTDPEEEGIQYDVKVALVMGETEVDVTKYFYINSTVDSSNGATTLIVGIENLLALENLDSVSNIDADTKVVVTYTATLNESASVTSGNINAVKLLYSNDPNNEGTGTTATPPENPTTEPTPTVPTGKTPVDSVYTYTTEIILNKVDGDNNTLTGAAFQITGNGVNVVVTTGEVYVENTEGTYYKLSNGTYTVTAPTTETASEYADTTTTYAKETKATIETQAADPVDYTAFVNGNGQLKFTGLGVGTYTITEIVTPDGYNTISPFKVTIGWDDATDDTSDCTWTYTWTGVTADDDAENSTTVVNQSGSTLPTTGGIGTTIFYVLGAVLVLTAAVLLVTKKRMATAE